MIAGCQLVIWCCAVWFTRLLCVCVWPAREGLPLPLNKRIGAIKLAADSDVCKTEKGCGFGV